jgi:hypothetical protein
MTRFDPTISALMKPCSELSKLVLLGTINVNLRGWPTGLLSGLNQPLSALSLKA